MEERKFYITTDKSGIKCYGNTVRYTDDIKIYESLESLLEDNTLEFEYCNIVAGKLRIFECVSYDYTDGMNLKEACKKCKIHPVKEFVFLDTNIEINNIINDNMSKGWARIINMLITGSYEEHLDDPDEKVRIAIAACKADKYADRLCKDKSDNVRAVVASLCSNVDILDELIKDSNPRIRSLVIHHGRYDHLLAGSKDESVSVREFTVLCCNANRHQKILEDLTRDSDSSVSLLARDILRFKK